MWAPTQREASVDHEAVHAVRKSIPQITATEVTNEKQNKTKQSKTKTSTRSITAWSYNMQEHGARCVEKTLDMLEKCASSKLAKTPFMDDHISHLKIRTVQDTLAPIGSHIVFRCLYLDRIGRPRITMQHAGTFRHRVEKFCKKKNARNTTDSTVFIVTLDCLTKHMFRFYKIRNHKHVFFFNFLVLQETTVSHSNAEKEILSLDASLRMEGKPALHMWDVKRILQRPGAKRQFLSHSVDHLSFDMTDHVPSNITGSSFTGQLLMCKDMEGVTSMIIMGRSPNSRHVSRTPPVLTQLAT